MVGRIIDLAAIAFRALQELVGGAGFPVRPIVAVVVETSSMIGLAAFCGAGLARPSPRRNAHRRIARLTGLYPIHVAPPRPFWAGVCQNHHLFPKSQID